MTLRKVLVVGPWGATGGVHTFMRNLCIHSNLKESWDFQQFNISRPPKKVSDNHHYNFLHSDPTRLFKSLVVTGKNAARYPRHVHSSDLLQIQSSDYYSFWEAMAYTKLAKTLRKPVVVRFGGIFDQFYASSSEREKKLIRRALLLPDAVIVQSSSWKTFFKQFIPEERLNIVPNAVPTPPPIPDRSERKEMVTALFICTNDAKRKGIDSVLKAVAKLKSRVRFVFVAVNDSVRSLVQENGLEEDIELHAPVSNEEMKHSFYPRSDIFLLPSRGEGFPNSMLEAMAAGLPVVTTPVGAIPDVLTPNVHGFMNDPMDVSAFIRDIAFLVDNPAERLAMGHRCYELVSTKYNLDVVFARFARLWDRLLRP